MTKLLRVFLFVIVSFIIFLFPKTFVHAQKFSYTSGIQIQNLENTPANVNLTFYRQDGTTEIAVNDTISALGSKTYFPINTSSGFRGSAVVTSDKKLAAVVNIHGNNFAANASYVGFSNGSTEIYLPLLMKGNSGYDTWFSIQNVGLSSANVTIKYSDGLEITDIIPLNAAKSYYQSSETHSQKVFSAIVKSDQPIVVTVIEESQNVMFAYNGQNKGAVKPVVPLVNANNNGYTTGIQIQNVGSLSTTVKLSYFPSVAGTPCVETQVIDAGKSATFTLAAFYNGANSTCVPGQRFIGSAQVTENSNSQPLTVIVNQHILGRNGEAYSGFDPSNATSKVVLPLIMDRNSGYWTGFNVMNVGSTSTTVTCTFTGTSYSVSATLAPGQALTDIQNGKIANRYVGSGTCVASGGGKIVAVVNELGPSGTADQLLVYEGINVDN